MKHAAFVLLLWASPALADELNGALPSFDFRPSARALPGQPPIAARPVLRRPAPSEAARPDAFDSNDGFRAALLSPAASDRWLVPTVQGDVMLVVEKGYLTGAELDGFCADVQEGVAGVPRVTGRVSRIRGRFTIYVYDRGPISQADVPGLARGEKGLMLRFVKEKADPLFHELTHLLAGYSHSQSLGEGIANVVQSRFRPGRAAAFIAAGADPHAESRRALAAYGADFRALIGAPGHEIRPEWREKRFDFYYASWSFSEFLLARGTMADFWTVADAGASDATYRRVYGAARAQLVEAWAARTASAAP